MLCDSDALVPWSELVDLVDGLQRDHTTHLIASIHGWAWVPAANEVALTLLRQDYLNSHLPEGDDPVALPLPWTEQTTEDNVTAEQRDALIRDFKRRSAINNL